MEHKILYVAHLLQLISSVLSGLMYLKNENMHHIKTKHESSLCFSCGVLPVTSCVSSWLLLLTILTDTFLDDCRNSGRPCKEMDKVIYLIHGAIVIKLLMCMSTDEKKGKKTLFEAKTPDIDFLNGTQLTE